MLRKLFGFSSSTDIPIDPIIPKENFSILKLKLNDGLAFATINTGYNKYPNKKLFPWYTQVLIQIRDKNSNGHPTSEEAEILNDIEDKITNFLKLTQTVHSLGRVTRNEERDIIYYIDKPAFDETKVKEFFDSINSIRIVKFTVEKDERWNNVNAFIQ